MSVNEQLMLYARSPWSRRREGVWIETKGGGRTGGRGEERVGSSTEKPE